jgi:hypothetical protein
MDRKKCDHKLVKELNRAMREGTLELELFRTRTGKTVDELWQAFAESLREPSQRGVALEPK